MGTFQFVFGALVMALVGLFADGTARPMVAGIAACSLLAVGLAWLTLRGGRQPEPSPEMATR